MPSCSTSSCDGADRPASVPDSRRTRFVDGCVLGPEPRGGVDVCAPLIPGLLRGFDGGAVVIAVAVIAVVSGFTADANGSRGAVVC